MALLLSPLNIRSYRWQLNRTLILLCRNRSYSNSNFKRPYLGNKTRCYMRLWCRFLLDWFDKCKSTKNCTNQLFLHFFAPKKSLNYLVSSPISSSTAFSVPPQMNFEWTLLGKNWTTVNLNNSSLFTFWRNWENTNKAMLTI